MKWPAALLSLAILGSALGAEPGMFRGDARHGGVYPGAGVPVLHGVKWKFETGGGGARQPRCERRRGVLRQQRSQLLRAR